MKHLQQVIEEGNLNDALRLYFNCNDNKIKCIHNGEVVDLPVEDYDDYEVEEVGEIEIDKESGQELVSVRTVTAFIRLAYDPDFEIISDAIDETEYVENMEK